MGSVLESWCGEQNVKRGVCRNSYFGGRTLSRECVGIRAAGSVLEHVVRGAER